MRKNEQVENTQMHNSWENNNKMKTNDIELKGEAIESFERVEDITDIILLGKDGGVRRIQIKEQK